MSQTRLEVNGIASSLGPVDSNLSSGAVATISPALGETTHRREPDTFQQVDPSKIGTPATPPLVPSIFTPSELPAIKAEMPFDPTLRAAGIVETLKDARLPITPQDVIDLHHILTNSDSALAYKVANEALPLLMSFDLKRLHGGEMRFEALHLIQWYAVRLQNEARATEVPLIRMPRDLFTKTHGNQRGWIITDPDIVQLSEAQTWAASNGFQEAADKLAQDIEAYKQNKQSSEPQVRYISEQNVWLRKNVLFTFFYFDLTPDERVKMATELKSLSKNELIVAQTMGMMGTKSQTVEIMEAALLKVKSTFQSVGHITPVRIPFPRR